MGASRAPLSTQVPTQNGTNDSNKGNRPAHNRVGELGNQTSEMVKSESEPDSLLDLYQNNNSNGSISTTTTDNDIPENMYKPGDDDPNGWIHRDKLAKIESEELQAAGINLAKAGRPEGKNVKRESSRERRGSDYSMAAPGRSFGDEKRLKISSPMDEEDSERANWDMRPPGEISPDRLGEAFPPQPVYNPVSRKSGSKIPVLTSSPLPIPQERIERDTPLSRKRAASNSMTPNDSISIPRLRPRSAGGLSMLNGEGYQGSPTPGSRAGSLSKPSSPTTRPVKVSGSTPSSATGARKVTPGARKPSVKAGPNDSPSQRPGTRSGDKDRPRTAINRPEGDPPWLATMYKPDPMLHPDLQIIPTHARKQQQQQWTEEGAVPVTYGRDFSPLAVHVGDGIVKQPSPRPSPPPSPQLSPLVEKAQENTWPLRPLPSTRNSNSHRPETGGSATGGYSTMPKVTTPVIERPALHNPRPSNRQVIPGTVPQRMQVTRLPEEKEEKVKGKGCGGCCIVM